ncbi:hypothetical protein BDQ12DRAFT_690746 [Crucibulum laeve]|uniref:Tudor domain-containing protein n=1 Tax=Crucibulum laeve TaxID=68775 RepID=A0A5C3LYD0_9AGAR|nr:hypothetical protein BDQ12DRAFT_690745 [Crucibulum laeve]TFK33783.1 hypothetical protein BDQ12DRAFT_690746 [Crucibulum laeve]
MFNYAFESNGVRYVGEYVRLVETKKRGAQLIVKFGDGTTYKSKQQDFTTTYDAVSFYGP